jgi:hypothetical protein
MSIYYCYFLYQFHFLQYYFSFTRSPLPFILFFLCHFSFLVFSSCSLKLSSPSLSIPFLISFFFLSFYYYFPPLPSPFCPYIRSFPSSSSSSHNSSVPSVYHSSFSPSIFLFLLCFFNSPLTSPSFSSLFRFSRVSVQYLGVLRSA